MKNRLLSLVVFLTIVIFSNCCFPSTDHKFPIEGVTPLPMAHSHNDYEHKVPLFDALGYGFCRIEPDIYILSKSELENPGKEPINKDFSKDSIIMVGHNFNEYKGTLYNLYLKDIEKQLGKGKFVFSGYDKPILFMIDMKTNGPGSIEFMNNYLSQYSGIINDYNSDVQDKPVSVFLSGYNSGDITQQDIDYLLKVERRYVGLDGRIDKPLLGQDKYPKLFPLISNAWDNRNEETFNKNIKEAHLKGQQIRFWGIDDKQETWDKLYKAGVDVISTDDHKGLRDYLLKQINN